MSGAAESFTLGILSGGEGQRLGGADKGLLEVQGAPQVLHVRAAFGDAPAAVLVSANRNLDRYRALGLAAIDDPIPGFQGPLAGAAALLGACRTPYLLSMPVDAVRIPGGLATSLFEALAAVRGRVAIARLHDDDGLQPTVALYRSSLAASAAAALRTGERSLQRWQAHAGSVEVRIAGSLGNRNHPEDYAPEEMARWARKNP